MTRPNLVEQLLAVSRADPVLRRNRRVVVAVSGGPDSTALLHALGRAAPALTLDLRVAHVDHGTRRGSSADARHVVALAGSLRLPVEVRRVDLDGKRSEEVARDARHAALEEIAVATGAATIAFGHTADDQAETVLLHLLRGAGLEGLAAMSIREGRRFRPLLRTWRTEVEAYCARNHLVARADPTNQSRRYTRNRVRAELIPMLERDFNPSARVALVRLADTARAEHDVVVAAAARWLAGRSAPYPRGALARQLRAVQAEVIRQVWGAALAAGAPVPGDAEVLGQALRLVARGGDGMIHLRKDLVLEVHGDDFSVGPSRPRR